MSKNEIVNENAPMLPALLKDLVIALVIAGAVLYFIRPTIVKQTSMQSTMNPNDYLIMYRQAYRSKAPKRGDIIIFKSDLPDEEGKDKLLIKRVIGLPGDEIQIKNQKVYINGKKYKYSPGQKVTINRNTKFCLNLYKIYTVRYYTANGKKEYKKLRQTVSSGKRVKLPTGSSNATYQFRGWSTKAGGNAAYKSGKYIRVKNNIKLTKYTI